MTGNVPFLMKDVVLLAASLYLLKQDIVSIGQRSDEPAAGPVAGGEPNASIEIDSDAYPFHLDRRDAARNSSQLPAERRL
jgi:hypothetical protein